MVLTGKARYGPEFEKKELANPKFKYAVWFIKRNGATMRTSSIANTFQKSDVDDFWKEVKVINNSKVPLAASIEGVVGAENIVKL